MLTLINPWTSLYFNRRGAWLTRVKGVTGAAGVTRHTVLEIAVKRITLRIARPRNALWRAILSMSFIRIARPMYFVFLCCYALQIVLCVV